MRYVDLRVGKLSLASNQSISPATAHSQLMTRLLTEYHGVLVVECTVDVVGLWNHQNIKMQVHGMDLFKKLLIRMK